MKKLAESMYKSLLLQTRNQRKAPHAIGLVLMALMCILYVTSCSQVIDLDTEEEGGQLVIFGRLSNSTQGNIVTVSRTASAGQGPQPVTNAVITITNAAGEGEMLVQVPETPGSYALPGNVLVREPGEQFALEVRVEDQTYRTELQQMPDFIGEDELFFEVGTNTESSGDGVTFTEDVVKITARTEFDNLPEEFYLRWNLEEAYTYFGTFLPLNRFPLTGGQIQCYVINDLSTQEIFLHDGRTNRATSIPERLFVNRRIDKSFQSLHYFNLIRSSLTEEAHEYWSKLQGIVNRQGSIFDTPVAPVPGNIIADSGNESVLGFFEVIAVDTTRLRITANQVPGFFFDNCVKEGPDIQQLFQVPRDCRQCLLDQRILDPECLLCDVLPGSSGVRPSYFE